MGAECMYSEQHMTHQACFGDTRIYFMLCRTQNAVFYTSVPRYVDHLTHRTVHTNQVQLFVITLIIIASVVLCYRSADQVAVPSLHYLRTQDMPGREAMRAGVVF